MARHYHSFALLRLPAYYTRVVELPVDLQRDDAFVAARKVCNPGERVEVVRSSTSRRAALALTVADVEVQKLEPLLPVEVK